MSEDELLRAILNLDHSTLLRFVHTLSAEELDRLHESGRVLSAAAHIERLVRETKANDEKMIDEFREQLNEQ